MNSAYDMYVQRFQQAMAPVQGYLRNSKAQNSAPASSDYFNTINDMTGFSGLPMLPGYSSPGYGFGSMPTTQANYMPLPMMPAYNPIPADFGYSYSPYAMPYGYSPAPQYMAAQSYPPLYGYYPAFDDITALTEPY